MSKLLATLFWVVTIVAASRVVFAWGHEGHEVIALIAEKNMTPAALERAKAILGGTSLAEVASWADDYRHDHRETGPWHYISIPLADSKIDMVRECPNITKGRSKRAKGSVSSGPLYSLGIRLDHGTPWQSFFCGVRVRGWMLFDAERKGEAENTAPGWPRNWSATAWELHPVTSIEVVPRPR